MESLTSAINVQVDAKDKEQAISILKDLGLNMSTFINITLKQLIKHDGLPFEISNPKPSKEFLKALQELDYMETHPEDYKSFHSVEELMEDLNKDD